jgi:hypothetical protein
MPARQVLALVILELRPHFLPRLAWIVTLLIYASCKPWDDRHAAFIPVETRSCKLLFLGCPQTVILLNDLSLLSSQGYRPEPLALGFVVIFSCIHL